jgi:hypothetical protein
MYYLSQLKPLMTWLAGISLVTFLTSLLLIPIIIGRLSADIFSRLEAGRINSPGLSPVRILFLILRNLVAVFLLLSGFIMLFIPGQGLLTMLIGFLLLSFPGKQKIVLQLVRRPGIRKSLDWVRKKQKVPPFQWPE